MESLLIVTGPPGAGKSTVAAALAERMPVSVLVEGDAFFGFLGSGMIEPWRPESSAQNQVVAEAAGLATGRFLEAYPTIYDGVLGPWTLPTFAAAAGLTTFDYVVLLPTADACVERVRTRVGHGFTDEAATRKMQAEFTEARVAARYVVDNSRVDVPGAVTAIEIARQRGDLRYKVLPESG